MLAIHMNEDSAEPSFKIRGELSIYNVAELQRELWRALELNQALQLDLSEVEDLDTAGVQLLLVFKREAVKQNKSVSFMHHSLFVMEVLDLLNLQSELGESTPVLSSHAEHL